MSETSIARVPAQVLLPQRDSDHCHNHLRTSASSAMQQSLNTSNLPRCRCWAGQFQVFLLFQIQTSIVGLPWPYHVSQSKCPFIIIPSSLRPLPTFSATSHFAQKFFTCPLSQGCFRRYSGPREVNLLVAINWVCHKTYMTSPPPFEKSSLNQELTLTGEYRLQNKRELRVLPWPNSSRPPRSCCLRTKRTQGTFLKAMLSLLRRLTLTGVLDEGKKKLDYILGLKQKDFLERRLQTRVNKLSLAKSIYHACVRIHQHQTGVHIPFLSAWTPRGTLTLPPFLGWWPPRPCEEEEPQAGPGWCWSQR